MANIQGRAGVDGQMDTTVNSHYCRGLSIDFFLQRSQIPLPGNIKLFTYVCWLLLSGRLTDSCFII